MSFVELYMDRILDLVEPNHVLSIHENTMQGVYIQPKRVSLDSYDLFLHAFSRAKGNRHLSSSNAYSSRSHTIFYLYVRRDEHECVLRIVDLAGLQMIRSTTTPRDGAEIRKVNTGLVAFIIPAFPLRIASPA